MIIYCTYLHHLHLQEHKLSALNELAGVASADEHKKDKENTKKKEHC